MRPKPKDIGLRSGCVSRDICRSARGYPQTLSVRAGPQYQLIMSPPCPRAPAAVLCDVHVPLVRPSAGARLMLEQPAIPIQHPCRVWAVWIGSFHIDLLPHYCPSKWLQAGSSACCRRLASVLFQALFVDFEVQSMIGETGEEKRKAICRHTPRDVDKACPMHPTTLSSVRLLKSGWWCGCQPPLDGNARSSVIGVMMLCSVTRKLSGVLF
ncbi:hypothetical protein BaRGS_00039094 [Batillaria attramentaria]|uniref:Uncharacterized protein n=1 Tax=Batillaria attramentaria TaxID=370345 RepID=A0ABD0J4X8_9CAEN